MRKQTLLGAVVKCVVTCFLAGCEPGATVEPGSDFESGDWGTDGGVDKALPGTIYQAESYTAQRGCSRATNASGYTGSGFVDFGDEGTYMEWNNISAAAAGDYRLTFRYANGSPNDRQAAIVVNGANVGNVTFASTDEWTTWRTVSLTKALRAGSNTIRVLANSSNGGPNLDSMEVVALDECPSDANKTSAGVCGCGTPDVDRDSDGTLDCKDGCPTDRNKTQPGTCGCGVSEGSCGGTYQAENYTAQSGCSRATNASGYTGSGFMNFGDNGTYVEWNNVSAASAGSYQLTFRYANAGSSPRQATILVNGANVGNVAFASTGEWTTWQTVNLTSSLRSGNNTIRVLANTSSGGPNLDSMQLAAVDACPSDPNKTSAGVCGCGTADVDRDSDGTMDCKDACPTDRNKTQPGACGCGVSEGSCGGGGGDAIRLPIEVLGPSGTKETVSFQLSSTTGITHLLVTCHSCGYNDHALDSDSTKVKAAVQVNGGAQIALKYYTLKSGGGIAGNSAIRLVAPDDAGYGGVGGGFRTNTMVLPISGLKTGTNTLSFTHVTQGGASIGFRIIDVNLLRGTSPGAKVLPSTQFVQDNPASWSAAQAAGTSDPTALQAAINQGKTLWYKNNSLYDPALDQFDGQTGGTPPLDGRIQASCSNCHAQDGRDLNYFNFSNRSIVERAYFHGVARSEGQKIAAYIRSLNLPVVARARPWNPPYQPGPGLDSRPAYEWAAGAGLDEVLDRDSDMEGYLFSSGTSADAVNAVVNRFGKLNMRELPVAVQMPDWNQWLPRLHPSDAFNAARSAITQDEDGTSVGMPFYDYLYQRAANDPSSRNVGDIVKRLEKWLTRDGTCYSQTVTKGPGWRANNSTVLQALRIGKVIAAGIGSSACEDVRYDRNVTRPIELAKHGLISWATVKHWELFHSNNLETQSAKLTQPVCIGSTCVDASEARGWVTDDKFDIGMNVFNRAPHYVGYNARDFLYQDEVVGSYETSIWYHLQMVLNAGHRRTGPNHYIYTIDHIERMQDHSGVSQSYRFWAGMIKQRQTQTTGRYGDVENGLQLDSAQPYRYYSNKYGDTSLRAGVGNLLWKRIVDRLLLDLAQDANRADWSATMQSGALQAASSTDFSLCSECFNSTSSPLPFPDLVLVGRNTARLIPQLRKLGVSETSIGAMLDWSKKTWPRGPWDQLRSN